MSGKLGTEYPMIHNSMENISDQYASNNSSIFAKRVTRVKDGGLKGNNTSSNLSISDRVNLLYSRELYTDVEFVLKGLKKSTKSIFPAHRNILAIGSPVFAKMLYSDQTDSIQNFPLSISIENISYEAFGNVIEFLYTDDAYLENFTDAAETLMAANQFEVPQLVKHCEKFLDSEPLSAENVCSVLRQAKTLKIETLKERCMIFIQQNTREVIKSNDFMGTSLPTLKVICGSEKLSLNSEVELFDALFQWAMRQRKGPPRTLLESLLKHIRFLALPAAKFGALVEKYGGIFTKTEALSIMLHLSNPSLGKELPKWCNKGPNRCFLLPSSSPVDSKPAKAPHGAAAYIANNDRFYRDENILLALKPCYQQRYDMASLTSVLEITCLHGRYSMKNINLEFQKPVETCFMELSISILVKPGGYCLHESLKVKNSDNINFMFRQKVLFGAHNKLYLRVKATNMHNYSFMQFDAENSTSLPNSPFVCNVSSIPNDYKLFCIREVNFENMKSKSMNII